VESTAFFHELAQSPMWQPMNSDAVAPGHRVGRHHRIDDGLFGRFDDRFIERIDVVEARSLRSSRGEEIGSVATGRSASTDIDTAECFIGGWRMAKEERRTRVFISAHYHDEKNA